MGLRRGLPPLPQRFKKLPIDPRGYPIPWFVAEVNGKRDFRMADGRKRALAASDRLCWLCGEKVRRGDLAFVIGPMCAVNRNTSEPGSHLECAEFAAQACPFMTLPEAQYRSANMPEQAVALPHGLGGNPGAVCIWITDEFKPYDTGGNWLIRLGEPSRVLWYAEGKPATRAQIMESLERRLPLLQKIADQEGPSARLELARMVECAKFLMPAE